MFNPLFDLSVFVESVLPSFSMMLKHDFFIALIGAGAGAGAAAGIVWHLEQKRIQETTIAEINTVSAFLMTYFSELVSFKEQLFIPANDELNKNIETLKEHLFTKGAKAGLLMHAESLKHFTFNVYEAVPLVDSMRKFANIDKLVVSKIMNLQLELERLVKSLDFRQELIEELRIGPSVSIENLAYFYGLLPVNNQYDNRLVDVYDNIESSLDRCILLSYEINLRVRKVAEDSLPGVSQERVLKFKADEKVRGVVPESLWSLNI